MHRQITGKQVFFIFVIAISVFFITPNIQAQIVQQDLKKQYEQEQKELESKTSAQGQSQDDPNQEIDIVGGPPPIQDYSTLSQQDADTVIEAAKALEEDNPELAKKLLNLGK